MLLSAHGAPGQKVLPLIFRPLYFPPLLRGYLHDVSLGRSKPYSIHSDADIHTYYMQEKKRRRENPKRKNLTFKQPKEGGKKEEEKKTEALFRSATFEPQNTDHDPWSPYTDCGVDIMSAFQTEPRVPVQFSVNLLI